MKTASKKLRRPKKVNTAFNNEEELKKRQPQKIKMTSINEDDLKNGGHQKNEDDLTKGRPSQIKTTLKKRCLQKKDDHKK